MLEQGMDNYHQFIYLINNGYEAVAALEELLEQVTVLDLVLWRDHKPSELLAASSSQIMLYSRMFQKGF